MSRLIRILRRCAYYPNMHMCIFGLITTVATTHTLTCALLVQIAYQYLIVVLAASQYHLHSLTLLVTVDIYLASAFVGKGVVN